MNNNLKGGIMKNLVWLLVLAASFGGALHAQEATTPREMCEKSCETAFEECKETGRAPGLCQRDYNECMEPCELEG